MKKLMPTLAAVLFSLFALGVFAVVLSMSYRALGYIFPGDLFDQGIGLVLFDLAAVAWFLTFVYKSESSMQYVCALLGFLVGLIGMIGLVGIEVGISSQLLATDEMVRPLVYIFIAVAVGHVVLVYARHAVSPEVSAKISLGIEKAKITDEGQRQAEVYLQKAMPDLGAKIAARLLQEVIDGVFDGPMVIDATASDVQEVAKERENFSLFKVWPWERGDRKSGSPAQAAGSNLKQQTRTQSPVVDDAGPDAGGPNNNHA